MVLGPLPAGPAHNGRPLAPVAHLDGGLFYRSGSRCSRSMPAVVSAEGKKDMMGTSFLATALKSIDSFRGLRNVAGGEHTEEPP